MTTVRPLHSTGITPLLRNSGPLRLPTCQHARLCLPTRPPGHDPRARRVSQVPRPICHCAPSAPTPTGRTGAYADVFPARAGFSISGSLATCNLRNEADLGSTFDGLRLTASLSTAFDRFARCPRRTGLAPRASYLHATDRSYMCHQHFTWQSPLRLLDGPGLSWHTKDAKGRKRTVRLQPFHALPEVSAVHI